MDINIKSMVSSTVLSRSFGKYLKAAKKVPYLSSKTTKLQASCSILTPIKNWLILMNLCRTLNWPGRFLSNLPLIPRIKTFLIL